MTVELGNQAMRASSEWGMQYLRNRISYVLQEDLLIGSEKAREVIETSALLRLPNHMSVGAKLKKAHEIIVRLDLTKCQENVIGDKGTRGVSGGEKKRVCN